MEIHEEIAFCYKNIAYFENRLKELCNQSQEENKSVNLWNAGNKTPCYFCHEKPVYAKGLCRNCYQRLKIHGTAEYKRNPVAKTKEQEKPVVPWRVKLCKDVFKYDETQIPELPPDDFDDSVDYAVETLPEKEKEVVLLRYKEGLSLKAIGDRKGLTRERIRQMQVKALQFLRHPSRIDYFKLGKKSVEQKKEEERIARKELEKKLMEEIKEREIYDRNKVKLLYARAAYIDIRDLDLSARSYNCLARAGVETLADLLRKSLRGLREIRNLGAKSCKEIHDKVKDRIGIELPDGHDPIETLGFTEETLEMLENKGVKTLNDVLNIENVTIYKNRGDESESQILKAIEEINLLRIKYLPNCNSVHITLR